MIKMPNLSFNEEESKIIHKAVNLYVLLKKQTLLGEELDTERKTQIQILVELRNALDHFMRALTVKYQLGEDRDEDYVFKQIQKLYSHMHRAGYDVLDWRSIILRDKISEFMMPFSTETISAIAPEYYKNIKPEAERISIEISKIRNNKDVDGNDLEENNLTNFKNYIKEVDSLQENYTKIVTKIPSLIEYDKKKKSENRKETLKKIFWIIIGAIIATPITAIITVGITNLINT